MKNLMNIISKALLCVMTVAPMLTSCYDDKAIWDSIDKLQQQIEDLELRLNEQLQALNSLIDGKTTITACVKNNDGSYDVTLSTGEKFTVMPDGTNFSALVSIKEQGGKRYWATYDANGKLVILEDAAGNPLTVENQIRVLVEDGIYYLEINGKKYMTGYDTEDLVQVFSSCVQHKDASGNVYAMTFTFGEGIEVTVTVDGYSGIIFKIADAIIGSYGISEYFIGYGQTQSVLLEKTNVVDYVMQIPYGWKVVERYDDFANETYLDITAPALKTVQAGAAFAEGELKVAAVVEGGKAAVSKLILSAEPFKTFDITGSKAVITPYVGVQKFVYGIMKTEEYDEETLLATVTKILGSSNDLPAGYMMSEKAVNAEHEVTYGSQLDPEAEYTFWAIPALYDTDSENGGYYVEDGMFRTKSVSPVSVSISKPAPSLYDADVKVSVTGAKMMYAGTALKSDDLLKTIIYNVNNGLIDPVEAAAFEGKASEFPDAKTNKDVEFKPGTTYMTWVLPVEEGRKTYSENDIFFKEFTTYEVVSGGSLEVEFGTPEADRTTISTSVTSEGAQMIFYAYMSKTDGDRLSKADNDTQAKTIFGHKNCRTVEEETAEAVVEKVAPSTTMWLYAVAVDKDGKYGKVNSVSAKTAKMEYNSLTVTATTTQVGSDDATLKIEVTGGEATGFVYWFGKASDPFWANSSYLNGTRNNATQYMALYPEDENIVRSMMQYGKISKDGTLHVDGLAMSTEYIFIVIAKDESGLYSKNSGYKMFPTLAANLGTIVRTGTDEWNRAYEQIKIEFLPEKYEKAESSFLSSVYAYNFSCPSDFTAYVTSQHKDSYTDSDRFITVEDIIIDIKNIASKYSAMGSTPIEYDENGKEILLDEPVWYDDFGNERPGNLLNIYKFYIHGYPAAGTVTFFAEGTHHGEDGCSWWDENLEVCTRYEESMKKIEQMCSLEYWTDYIKDFRGLTNEESIAKSGLSYYNGYAPYYKDTKPLIYVNDGTNHVELTQPYAFGLDDTGHVLDMIIVVLKDRNNNHYEPMYFPVENHFN